MGVFDPLFGRGPSKNDDAKIGRSGKVCEPCKCLAPQFTNKRFGKLLLHAETQDTNCEAWRYLENLVEQSASKNSTEFSPGLEMPPEQWREIITLPATIGKLTSVKRLHLYGSNLVRIPPEIGAMESLEELNIYTSYRLHWLPYEVTRCQNLKRSLASTRALYGNYKYRPPFPKLGDELSNVIGNPNDCSVCKRGIDPKQVRQVWISLRVATDVFPLLVNACSEECVRSLPRSEYGYFDGPHRGGFEIRQPPIGDCPPKL